MTIQSIYAICLVAGLIFTLFSAVAGHLFGGHGDGHVGMGGHADTGLGHDGVPGISILSPTVLATFVTAFGAFGLIFTHVDATSNPLISAPICWIVALISVSNINGSDASENETTQYEKLDQNKWYAIRVRVADGKIECWLNDKQMVDVDLKDKRISTRIEVDPNKPLGICCYNVESGLKDIKLRRLAK